MCKEGFDIEERADVWKLKGDTLKSNCNGCGKCLDFGGMLKLVVRIDMRIMESLWKNI